MPSKGWNMSAHNGRNPLPNMEFLLKGLYGRVANDLGLDSSYVIRAARGEIQSTLVEAALQRELKRIADLASGAGTRQNAKDEPSPLGANRARRRTVLSGIAHRSCAS